jgi:DNA helicase IV
MPRGVPVTVEKVKRPQMANRAFQLASEWGARSSNSVAILSPYVLEKSAFVGSEKGHGVTLSMDLADLQVEGKAYFSTIKSFKGIEADCVIVIDADDPNRGNPAFTLEDLYVACTRAKARLAILVHDEATAGFYRGK